MMFHCFQLLFNQRKAYASFSPLFAQEEGTGAVVFIVFQANEALYMTSDIDPLTAHSKLGNNEHL